MNNCSVCGMFVPHGVVHSCGGSPTYPTVSTYDAAMLRVAAALERIAAALEKLPDDPNTRAWLGIEPQFPEDETP